MRGVLFGVVSATVFAVSAQATDLYAPASVGGYKGERIPVCECKDEQAAAYSWAGTYMGASGGYGWGTGDVFTGPSRAGATNSAQFRPHGAFAGDQIGYNLQVQRFVIGIEADAQGANIVGAASVHGTPAHTSFRWFGTARERAGIAIDNTLLYATGGFAYGSDSSGHNSGVKTGYVLGGGVEYAFDSRLSAKAEYQFIDLGKDTLLAGTAPLTTTLDAKHSYNSVRFGLNYHLTSTYKPLK